MRAVLDINVFLARICANHILHRRAMACVAAQAAQMAGRLGLAFAAPKLVLWAAAVSLRAADLIHWLRVLGQCRATDTCMQALAVRNKWAFEIFDRRAATPLVLGAAPDQLELAF